MAAPAPAQTELTRLAGTITEFIASCRDPAIDEPGEDLLILQPGAYSFEERCGRFYFQAWDDRRTLSRRILRILRSTRGRLELEIERFAKHRGTLTIVDQASRANFCVPVRSARQSFRERFRRMLSRQFPGFAVNRLSTEPDLEHSLSPSYPRALLERGGSAWAAIASPPGASHADGVLTFGLIWLDYLRRKRGVSGLLVFLPEGHEKTTCLRVRHLDPRLAEFRVFAYEGNREYPLDLADYGNVDTKLEDPRDDGLPTRWTGPEREIELSARANPEAFDARLLPNPVYGQAPTLASGQRGIIDLLTAGRDGRLTLIELKASEDVHLPLQALDYWIRVKWHLDRGEISARGYFPGIELAPEPPRIILAAPALEFHPANETILRFFNPTIEVERIGLGPHHNVVFRM
jgi:hypothetical protein